MTLFRRSRKSSSVWKLVAGLAWVASRRLQGKVPVHVVDLIPANHRQEENSFLFSNGIRHVLIDTSEQSARIEASREIAWLERQIVANHDDGLVFVDVPERVMHARRHAMAAADMVLVLLPASMNSIRAVEDVESELADALSQTISDKLCYLLVESNDFESLPPRLQDELLSRQELFVPRCLQADSVPGLSELPAKGNGEMEKYRSLQDISSFIFAKINP